MDAGFLDPDQRVVERFARSLARVERRNEAGIDIIVAQFAQGFAVTLPEGFEHHAVSTARAFEELGDVEAAVGGGNLADAAFDRGHHAFKLHRTRRGDRGRGNRARDAGRLVVRIEALRHRLFLVLRPATEHRIEPQAQKGGDHGEENDFKHWTFPIVERANTGRGRQAIAGEILPCLK